MTPSQTGLPRRESSRRGRREQAANFVRLNNVKVASGSGVTPPGHLAEWISISSTIAGRTVVGSRGSGPRQWAVAE